MLYTRKERNGYWVETGLRCLTLSVQICGLGFIVYGGTLAAGQNITGDVVVCSNRLFPLKIEQCERLNQTQFPILIVYNAIHVLRLQAILRPGKNQQPPSPPSRGLISCLIFLEMIVTGVAVMGSIFIIFTHDPKYISPSNFGSMVDPDDRSGEWEFPGWAMMWTSA